jgi:hypothetical protein
LTLWICGKAEIEENKKQIMNVILLTKTEKIFLKTILSSFLGRAVAQAGSRWLPTATSLVCVLAACGVCGGQSGTGAGFLRVLRLPLSIIPPIYPSS